VPLGEPSTSDAPYSVQSRLYVEETCPVKATEARSSRKFRRSAANHRLTLKCADSATFVPHAQRETTARSRPHARPAERRKKDTESVTPSSGFRPTPAEAVAARRTFNLGRSVLGAWLTVRAAPNDRQGPTTNPSPQFAIFSFRTAHTAVERACSRSRFGQKEGRTRGSGHKIRRAGNAFVHLPEELSASAYGSSGGFDLPAPRTRRRRDCKPCRTQMARPCANEFGANCEER
jgi:hypothetical protein